MCELRRSNPRRPDIPNVPEERGVCACGACGGPVRVGEGYHDAWSIILCDDCVNMYFLTAKSDIEF